MSEEAAEIAKLIAASDDFRVMLMFETFLSEAAALGHDPERVAAGFPGDALGVSATDVLCWIEDDLIAETAASPAMSAEFARTILTVAAAQPVLGSIAAKAVLHPVDEKLKAGVWLKFGIMASALMLIASTGFEVRIGEARVWKEPLSPDAIAALTALVTNLNNQIPLTKRNKDKSSN